MHSEKNYFQRNIMEVLKVQMFIHPVTLETQVSLMTWILRLGISLDFSLFILKTICRENMLFPHA